MHRPNIGPNDGLPPPGRYGPMDLYDTFPKRIRAALQSSAFDYAIGTVADMLISMGEERTFHWLCNGDRINIRNCALADYGPDHPQAK